MSIECGAFDHCGCKDKVFKLQAEKELLENLCQGQVMKFVELQTKIDTAIEQLNEHIHEDKHHLDDILFELEGGADSIKLELCDE